MIDPQYWAGSERDAARQVDWNNLDPVLNEPWLVELVKKTAGD